MREGELGMCVYVFRKDTVKAPSCIRSLSGLGSCSYSSVLFAAIGCSGGEAHSWVHN